MSSTAKNIINSPLHMDPSLHGAEVVARLFYLKIINVSVHVEVELCQGQQTHQDHGTFLTPRQQGMTT
ncbi:hypothetical protein VTN77DRAFT_2498 [Rasamsonia byssochlamydoides]|uniref:uncharacterized protein n=1 Tax=Rasamsonia byssochlamydoides TaxID=89139 RepID=UPI0037429DC9